MTDNADWLAKLKVGDLVRVRYIEIGPMNIRVVPNFVRVVRLTKTRIVTDNASWFRRTDGRTPTTNGRHWWQIEKPTAAQARKAKR